MFYLDLEKTFTCLESTMEASMCKIYISNMWNIEEKCMKLIKSTILRSNSTVKTSEQHECCSGVFIVNCRGVFRTQSNIYNGAFLEK